MTAPGTAVVGAGMMGFWHARYAAGLGARIRGIVDVDAAAARRLADRFSGALAFGSLQECIAAGGIEAVHVCTGASSHAELALLALGSGRHVLVEKPAALGERDAVLLAEAARQAGRVLAAVHQFPFQAGALRLARWQSTLGTPLRADFVACSAGGEGLDPAARRALLREILPHPISLFRLFLGRAVDVGSWRVLQASDDALTLRALCDGIELGIAISLRGRPTRNELTLIGTHATAQLDLYHGYGFLERGGVGRIAKLLAPFRRGLGQLAAASSNLAGRAARREPAFPGLRELIARFHGAIGGDVALAAAPDEILEAARLIERIAGETERTGSA